MKIGNLKFHGSLLTYFDHDRSVDVCLGYLINLDGRGVYDATHGLIEGLTAGHCEAHNKALDDAMMKGLDENCEVGQGATFYWHPDSGEMRTFIGTLVSDDCLVRGSTVTFRRSGMKFAGRLQSGTNCMHCRRTA